jgi:pantoate--beta-alanine ligase
LQKYPRTFAADCAALEALGVDYLFAPPVEEMYPSGFRTGVVVEGLSERLEGRSRPGHFRGVATVVLKLFEIVQPHTAFFGRKDAQQLRIISQMAQDLDLDVQIAACPIVREKDGLALSSRNAYLSGDSRRAATVLYRSLDAVRHAIEMGERNAAHLVELARKVLADEPAVTVDYVEIADAETLDPVLSLRETCYVLVAAAINGTRLIDNALVENIAVEGRGDSFRVTL